MILRFKLFSPAECREIIAQLGHKAMDKGVVRTVGGYKTRKGTRDVSTSYHRRSKAAAWIFDRMDEAFFRSAKKFRFDVEATVEPLKYLVYRSGQHFNTWHIDTGDHEVPDYLLRRKLSMSVELSPRGSYKGGILKVVPGYVTSNPPQGWAAIFPSFFLHCVTPVTQGVRHALVNWISGPPFR